MTISITHVLDSLTLTEYRYNTKILSHIPPRDIVFVADIGGTNSNFAICALQNNTIYLCISFHAPSQKISDYTKFISLLLQHIRTSHHIDVQRGCIGAAGALMHARQCVKPTNLSAEIDIAKIIASAGLEQLFLINDFEAVALGLPFVDAANIITIREGIMQSGSQKAAIGAGTGLGKVALLWNEHHQEYLPLASEGGHADCSAQTEMEAALFVFMQKEQKTPCPISWEAVLSGKGLSTIYRFLGERGGYQQTSVAIEIQETGFKPDRISHYAHQDKQCHDTFALYTTFYARCAKNYALDVLSLGGMYIAGGIAARNVNLFKQPQFYEEFLRCGKQQQLLVNMPLYIIADYNISLFGAAAYITLKDRNIL